MNKKKILMALLASACLSAGVAGVAACKTEPTYATDSAIYNIYSRYCEEAENNGESPKSYEDWLLSVLNSTGLKGEQGDPGAYIDSVSIVTVDGKQFYEFKFTNNKIIRIAVEGDERQVSSSFTITAVDQKGNPVKDAYFNIGYYDSKEYSSMYLTKDGTFVPESNRAQAYAMKTNSKGIATFYAFLEKNDLALSIYPASAESINIEGVTAKPNGYDENFGTTDGMKNFSIPLIKDSEGNYTAKANYILSNSWQTLYDPNNDLRYKRYAENPYNPDTVKVEYSPYVKYAVKDRYNYFTFAPYRANIPSTGDPDIDQINEVASKLASGKYRISWTASNKDVNVDLKYYNFYAGNYFSFNEDNSPSESLVIQRSGTAPTDENILHETYNKYGSGSYEDWVKSYKATFSGGNYVDVEITTDNSRAALSFAFIADSNCNVTISVERTADAAVWTNEEKTVDMPAGASREIDQVGTVKDVPLDSEIVKGADGYYHIGTDNGPIVYVQLTKATRVDSDSMKFLAAYPIENPSADPNAPSQSLTGTIFSYTTDEFNEETNSGVHIHTDYSPVVLGYSNLVNSDGLYRVNDLLLEVLKRYCTRLPNYSNYKNYWVAACSYYGPVADGTQNAPYEVELSDGKFTGTLNSSGTTYFSFKPSNTTYYAFSTSNGTELIINDAELKLDDAYYKRLNALEEYVFSVKGTGSVTLNIKEYNSSNTIEYWSEINAADREVEHGTPQSPIVYNRPGVYLVHIDHTAYKNPISLRYAITIMGGDGTYKISVYNSDNAVILDANSQSLIDKNFVVTYGSQIDITVDCPNDGYFFIKITKVSESTVIAALNEAFEFPVINLNTKDKTDGKKNF